MENKTTSVTTYYKKLTTKNVFSVAVIVRSNWHFEVFTSNVQYVNIAAVWRIQASDATGQWRDQWNAVTVAPLSDISQASVA